MRGRGESRAAGPGCQAPLKVLALGSVSMQAACCMVIRQGSMAQSTYSTLTGRLRHSVQGQRHLLADVLAWTATVLSLSPMAAIDV